MLKPALELARLNRRNCVDAIRIRRTHREWIPTDCHLFSTVDDNLSEPIDFVLEEASAIASVTVWVAELEQHLTVGPSTVQNHLADVYPIFDVHSRPDLIGYLWS